MCPLTMMTGLTPKRTGKMMNGQIMMTKTGRWI